MTLQSQNYVATVADIQQLVRDTLAAEQSILDGAISYLRALAATAIQQCGGDPSKPLRKRGRQRLLSGEALSGQLSVLEAVHAGFYEAARDVIEEAIPANTPQRAKEINRRTNRYRTAMSDLRRWVRAGHNLLTLDVQSLTKRQLQLARERLQPPSVPRLKRRVETQTERFVGALLELAKTDKGAALTELRLTMGLLAQQIVELGGTVPSFEAPSFKGLPPRAPRAPAQQPMQIGVGLS